MKTTTTLLNLILGFTLLYITTSCEKEEPLPSADYEQVVPGFEGSARIAASLDYGLYWFNTNNQSVSGFDAAAGQPRSVSSTYYDPSKPTIIYFHGWQPVFGLERENFRLTNGLLGVDINTVERWKQQGWNVGIFYWDQFANELEVKDAEAKIWSATGPKGMRYWKSDGSYATDPSINVSVSELAYEQLSRTIGQNSSGNLRFAGHSLGNQLATNVARLFGWHAANGEVSIVPNRVELLDPFWSQDGKGYLGDYNQDGKNDWTGERCRWYVQELQQEYNIAFTWYRSSGIADLGIGDKNRPLEELVALISLRFWYLNGLDIPNKHNYVRHHYFWSLSFEEPTECTIRWTRRYPTGNVAASAATSDERIRQMMGNQYHWDQVEGRYTVSPDDDWFERKSY
ncbi:hypothetical protein [Algivirga pacifica]|uniref:Cell adhesion protein n=1 Tax=Algivirga pacifica TaxID=1162670 RepID=A0ABP9D7N8_9BACT